MDEPMLKAMMTQSMMKVVEFRMAASSNGALACERTTVGRGTAIGQTIAPSRLDKFFHSGAEIYSSLGRLELRKTLRFWSFRPRPLDHPGSGGSAGRAAEVGTAALPL